MNKIFQIDFPLFVAILFLGFTSSCQQNRVIENEKLQLSISIPTEGNSWVINDLENNDQIIKKGGITNWSEKETIIRTYFKTEQAGNLNVAFFAKTVSGSSEIKVTCENKTEIVTIENIGWDTIPVGTFNIENPGYHFIEIQGLQKSGEFFPEIESILIGGEATNGKVYFAKDDFYWGRRGPSVHLNFQIPENAGEIVYFYNEITVPENNDVLGSYFMANGFGQGYFGMQVNPLTERRILFSVWSPYKTDNPNDIPEDQKIILLKKGEDVYTGEFGNEGSGGQSYYKFLWEAGTTYKFLLKGQPTGSGETDFTAWFFAPEVNQWKLIASFRRPITETHLTNLYSFLENFHTETGNVTRKGLFSNQWIYDINNQWIELTKIKFTADATARKESRMDYSGGVDNNFFFLKNCGFFSETTIIDSYFERQGGGEQPVINFEDLP